MQGRIPSQHKFVIDLPAPDSIVQLVDTFRDNLDAYKSGQFNETQVRHQFIDPFFEALGWDVNNRRGYSELFKEVVHEDAIKIGGATKAPDYCFRIGGQRIFFVEAKKPSVNIKDDISPAFQLRRYAWSAKLPLSILTDFEELAVYDCRTRPGKTDRASTGRVMYVYFTEYAERWDEIAGVFSREAVLKGSFHRYAKSATGRGAQEVDRAFLDEIERWRDTLARNIALRNPSLSTRELNFAVQRTIDRIIFLRICEDRGIETYGQLQALQNGEHVYRRLTQLFHRADERYNSGLFHFRDEKGRGEPPDELTLALDVDDAPLRDIFRTLYYPESPYEFSVLPADILGQVYEQFLGKVIRLTAGHRAKVEEKPEVRKAGGVYYTPKYIVDYIVRNTVGTLLEGKTPKQVSSLRVLDPACGSGSFLIGAFQRLLDWHLEWYVAHDPGRRARGRSPAVFRHSSGEWRLTTAEKKRILLNNIYGVDIDRQAVEVTKLSLLLKVLEGESEETLEAQLKMFKERALPDLGGNIKCGNSLIGSDFYEGKQIAMLDDEEMYRVNAFDWDGKDGFPDIMKAGGFDAVIGNPPYIRIQTMKEWAPAEVEFYKQRYKAAGKGNYDIYVVFVEKGLSLLNDNGLLGFILPHKFFNSKYGEPLRQIISEGKHLSHVVHFGDQQVFSGASTYTCLLFLTRHPSRKFHFVKAHDLAAWQRGEKQLEGNVPAKKATFSEWNFVVGPGSSLFEKLSEMPVKLGDVADRLAQGIRTSANEIYVLELVSYEGELIKAQSKQLNRIVSIEKELTSLLLKGREIKPFKIEFPKQIIIIPYYAQEGNISLIPEDELIDKFPHTYDYLIKNKTYLEAREHDRMKGSYWYGYVYPKNIDIMFSPKIIVPDIANRASFALDTKGIFAFVSGYGITLNSRLQESYKYILGILNSRLLDFFLKHVSTSLRGGFFRYFTQYIKQIPIRRINYQDKRDISHHDHMVELVSSIIELNNNLNKAREPQTREMLEKQITLTDKAIDHLVYELYGLTEKEKELIEKYSL